jgi:predicted acylesterase/phospholipase RssA
MGSYRLLRNYESSQSAYDPTLVEAIKASMAIPTLLESVHLGPDGQQEEFISGSIRFNNPIWITIEEAQSIFGSSQSTSCLLSIGSGVSAPISLEKQATDMEKLIQQIQMDSQSSAELAHKRFGDLDIYFRFSVDQGLERERMALGDVTSHSLAYIQRKEISDKLDRCVAMANRHSRITIGRVCTYVLHSR